METDHRDRTYGFNLGMSTLCLALVLAVPGPLRAVPQFEKVLMVDDFHRADFKTLLGGNINAWIVDPDDPSQWCRISYGTHSWVSGPQGYYLNVDYSVSSNKKTYLGTEGGISSQETGFHGMAFGGIAFEIGTADLTPYKYLVFTARGDKDAGFTRSFKLELLDGKRNAAYIFRGLTSSWKRFTVPLKHFSSRIDMRKVRVIVLVFDDNTTRKAGTIHLDDIYFSGGRNVKKHPSNLQVYAYPNPDPIVVDGDLSEWDKDVAFQMETALNDRPKRARKRTSVPAESLFSWNEDALFFGARVYDREVVCNAESGKAIFRWDVVELYLDLENDGHLSGGSQDYHLGFSPTSPSQKSQVYAWLRDRIPEPEEVQVAARLTDDGYTIESRISWEFLSRFRPSSGKPIGVSIAVNDVGSDKLRRGISDRPLAGDGRAVRVRSVTLRLEQREPGPSR